MLLRDIDLILIPVNQGNSHWTLLSVDMRARRIRYYDSFRGRDTVGGFGPLFLPLLLLLPPPAAAVSCCTVLLFPAWWIALLGTAGL